MEDCRLTRKERITRATEFDCIVKQGTRYTTEHFTVIIHKNTFEIRRLGISVSKKVGGAVKRNRVKRLIREFFRLHKHELPHNTDVFFIAKPSSIQLNYSGLCEELLNFFKHVAVAESEVASLTAFLTSS